MGDGLQEMGLAQTNSRMQVQRAKGRCSAAVAVGYALHGVEGEFVRPPNLESGEGQPPIEGGPGQGVAERDRGGRSAGRAAIGAGAIDGRLERLQRRFLWDSTVGRRAFDQRREWRRRSHGYENLPDWTDFGIQRRGHMASIVSHDPALEKACRNGKPGLSRSDRFQSETSKPAVENSIPDLGPQTIAAATPRLAKWRKAGDPVVEAIRIGFVVHIHGRISGAGWTADVAAMPWKGLARRALCLRPGQPTRLPPADRPP